MSQRIFPAPQNFVIAATDSGISGIMHIGVRRWGGDSSSSYNWQLDLENLNVNLYFTTYLVGDGVHNSFDLFHERNLETGTVSLSTFPLLDWTPKLPPDRALKPNYQYTCSYPASKYGQVDALTSPFVSFPLE